MNKNRHKHLSEKEILKYIKSKGKLKEIEKHILECKECFYKYKSLYYKQKIYKYIEKKAKKEIFVYVKENFKLLTENIQVKEKKLAYLGGDKIIKELKMPNGTTKITLTISNVTLEFLPDKNDKQYKISIYKDNVLIARTMNSYLMITYDLIQGALIRITHGKEIYEIFFDKNFKWFGVKN